MSHIAGKESASDKIKILSEHFHSPQKVYPTGGAGVTVTADAAAWTLGSFAEIVPASTITDDFDLHWLNIETVSGAAVFELVLYAATTEISRIRFSAVGIANNILLPEKKVMTELLPANTQIQAKIMSSTTSADSVSVSVEYHEY